ncbi:MAG: hypothetical protein A2901_09195 [Elusimicrobia bacterium RIFCSPLOWO2_01_FULL_54_10]|nr:MAG: hypothetical protein A2901_09195 [Elusimicrobia bacterium RIFCSPLOWO2_01_FULL_54_10]
MSGDAPVKKRRILLVEDEPNVVELMEIFLSRRGYDIFNVVDGSLVIDKVREIKPDLIILDIMLPKLNGFEVCGLLKSDPALMRIPVLILSALVQKTEIEMGIRMGADQYMTKPFHNAELLANIEKLIAKADGPGV